MSRKIAELFVELNADTSKYKSAMSGVERSIDNLGRKLSSVGRALTLGVTLPLAAAGGAAIKFAMDAVESENLFEVSMKGMAAAARDWSEQLSDSLGLNRFEIRKTVATFNVMLNSMGLGEEAAYEMAKGLSQLTYDMASFYNLRPEEAFQKLQAGISGEIEPLKRLGILVNENTIKHWALTHGLIKQGETLSEQQKILARYNVIMEQTTDAQGDLARTLDSPTNKIRLLKSKITELGIEIGMKLLPAFEKILKKIESAVRWFADLSDANKDLVIKIALVAAAIGPLLLLMGKLLQMAVLLKTANLALAPTFGIVGVAVLTAYGAYKLLIAAREKWEKSTGNFTTEETKRWAELTKQVGGWTTFMEKAAKKFTDITKGAEGYRAKMAELNEIWDTYGQNTEETLRAIAEGKHGQALKSFLDELGGKHLAAAQSASDQGTSLDDLEKDVGKVADTISNSLNTGLESLFNKFKAAETGAKNFSKSINAIKETITTTAIPAMHNLAGVAYNTQQELQSHIFGANEAIVTNYEDTTTEVSSLWSQMADGLQTKWASTIGEVLRGATSLKDGLKGIWDAILVQFTDMIGQMIAKWTVDLISSMLSSATKTASDIGSAFKSVADTVAGVGSTIGGIIVSLAKAIATAAKIIAGAAKEIAITAGLALAIYAAYRLIKGLFDTVFGGGSGGGGDTTTAWHIQEIWKNTKETRDYMFLVQRTWLTKEIPERISKGNAKLDRANSILRDIRGGIENLGKIFSGINFGQHGLSMSVAKPTLFMAGERGMENVNIEPSGQSQSAPAGGNINVTVQPTPFIVELDGRQVGMGLAKFTPELTKKQIWRIHNRSLTDV